MIGVLPSSVYLDQTWKILAPLGIPVHRSHLSLLPLEDTDTITHHP